MNLWGVSWFLPEKHEFARTMKIMKCKDLLHILFLFFVKYISISIFSFSFLFLLLLSQFLRNYSISIWWEARNHLEEIWIMFFSDLVAKLFFFYFYFFGIKFWFPFFINFIFYLFHLFYEITYFFFVFDFNAY